MAWLIAYNTLWAIGLLLGWPIVVIALLIQPKFRAGFGQKFGILPNTLIAQIKALPQHNRIWLHAVSVGEFQAARPLVEKLLSEGFSVILSTTTKTGNTLAKQTYPTLPIFYFPFDLPGVLAKVMTFIKPTAILMMETEIWPNFATLAYNKKIPLLMVNGRLSQKSYQGYVRFKWFFNWVFKHYKALLVQSQQDAQRFEKLGVPANKITVVGNIKFVSIGQQNNTQAETMLRNWSEQQMTVVFASTHQGEEESLLNSFSQLKDTFPRLKAIIAPRHPERFASVETLLKQSDLAYQTYTQLSRNQAGNSTDILLLDTIGLLTTAFQTSTLAIMGGSFVPTGGHNPLEPLQSGIPVLFGPHMFNFQRITEQLLEANAAIQVASPHALTKQVEIVLSNPEQYLALTENGSRVIQAHQGILQALWDGLIPYIPYPA